MTDIWSDNPPLAKVMPAGTLIMRTGEYGKDISSTFAFIALQRFVTPSCREYNQEKPGFLTGVWACVYDIEQQRVRDIMIDFSTSWKYTFQEP